MSTILAAHTHRLAFPFGKDRETFDAACAFDSVEFPSGVSLRFQIGVYEESLTGDFWNMQDVANLRSEVKKMRPGQVRPLPEDLAYMQSDPIAPDSATITAAGWSDGSEQHATFTFSPSETALDPGKYWLVFSGFLTNGDFVSFGWGQVDVVQDGTGVYSPVAPLDPTYLNAIQIEDLLNATGLVAIYDTTPGSPVQQSDADYYYYAWARLDGTGYKAERWNMSGSAGETTGALPIPADLTALTYT